MLTLSGGEAPEVVAAQVIFWILLPLVLFARPRWAVLIWLVMGNLDATGPGQNSTAVGWINAAKGVLLPLYLWWRLRRVPDEVSTTAPARLWLILTGYAALAILWSPVQIPGIKLVGNMAGLLLSMIVMEKAVRRGLLRTDSLAVLILGSLSLGILQTYYFGSTSYGFDGVDRPIRFSSFIAAQQYGALLVAFLTIILWHSGFRPFGKIVLSLSVGVALALNGSRTWFIGAVIVSAVYAWLCSRRIAATVAFAASTIAMSTLLVLNLTRFDTDILEDTSSRILATLSAAFTGQDTSNDVGLGNLKFRLAIYQGVLDETRASSPRQILLGHGTSSGGNVALRVFPTRYSLDRLDFNRTIHNEWLRAFYEWGVFGLGLWIGVFASILAGLVMCYRNASSKRRASAALSFLPAFIAALATENIVAGAGNGVTMSFVLVMAILWEPVRTAPPVGAPNV